MTQTRVSDEPPVWSLAEHLEYGRAALTRIGADQRIGDPQPVCHHFWAFSKDEDEFDDTVSGRRFAHLADEFLKLGLTFEADRLEAWETIKPDEDWLAARVPALFDLARNRGLSGYQGWSWEPRNGQPVSACEFQVINNRSEATDLN